MHAIPARVFAILRSAVCAFALEIGEGVLLLLVLTGNASDAGDGLEIDTAAPWRRSRRRVLPRVPRDVVFARRPVAFLDDTGRVYVEVALLPDPRASVVVEIDIYRGGMESLWPDRPLPWVKAPRVYGRRCNSG